MMTDARTYTHKHGQTPTHTHSHAHTAVNGLGVHRRHVNSAWRLMNLWCVNKAWHKNLCLKIGHNIGCTASEPLWMLLNQCISQWEILRVPPQKFPRWQTEKWNYSSQESYSSGCYFPMFSRVGCSYLIAHCPLKILFWITEKSTAPTPPPPPQLKDRSVYWGGVGDRSCR